MVVPLVGTWIEMNRNASPSSSGVSCPSWARGLKSPRLHRGHRRSVVPLVGTWIEILLTLILLLALGRAPRGHVD